MTISLSGKFSKACASASLHEFNIIRYLNASINYMKAPKIIGFYWVPPKLGRKKINYNSHFLACFASYFDIQDALFAELNSAIMSID
ncbi:hypothetical protein Lalb_Chr02g0159361 [Lupinus albus]|uniref:Uncharacterized protein n=1 Tax=Lupinus albus TaxID=3870 RepID=A0A6A4R234_LUPAL|nr:hypothetical protein Lalb_Chr02g0159361 [Lupinus albus]